MFARPGLLPFARRGGIVSSKAAGAALMALLLFLPERFPAACPCVKIRTIPWKCRNHAVFRGIVRFRHPPTGHKLPAPIRETRA